MAILLLSKDLTIRVQSIAGGTLREAAVRMTRPEAHALAETLRAFLAGSTTKRVGSGDSDLFVGIEVSNTPKKLPVIRLNSRRG